MVLNRITLRVKLKSDTTNEFGITTFRFEIPELYLADSLSALLLEGKMGAVLKIEKEGEKDIVAILGAVWYGGLNNDRNKSSILKLEAYESQVQGPLSPFRQAECKLIVTQFGDDPNIVKENS